jgi:hypothetical protein
LPMDNRRSADRVLKLVRLNSFYGVRTFGRRIPRLAGTAQPGRLAPDADEGCPAIQARSRNKSLAAVQAPRHPVHDIPLCVHLVPTSELPIGSRVGLSRRRRACRQRSTG